MKHQFMPDLLVISFIKFENNRYSVSLMFKVNRPILPDNYQLSLNRLKKLKERLDKTPHLLNEYGEIFDEYLKLGIIEEVQTQGDTGQVVYLPHKEVVKEDRSATKLRIVFDASAKYKDTMSLNDVLYKGPCLNADLYSLLLKFRVHPIVLTADIEKAYLQININEKQRLFEIFTASKFKGRKYYQIQVYESHFWCYVFSIPIKWNRSNACKNMKISILISLGKLKSIFMWTILILVQKLQKKVLNFTKKVKSRFSEASLNIRKLNISLKISEIFKEAVNIVPTKRNILSVIIIVYDPTGYLQPLAIMLKILFEEIMQVKYKMG